MQFVLSPKHGNKIDDFFALNSVRVSNPQRLTHTHIMVEYPPSQGGKSEKLQETIRKTLQEN